MVLHFGQSVAISILYHEGLIDTIITCMIQLAVDVPGDLVIFPNSGVLNHRNM